VKGGLLVSKKVFDKLRIELWASGTADKEKNGGYCCMLYSQIEGRPYTKMVGGYAKDTTITRMTLKSIVVGLREILNPSFVHIYTSIPQVSSGLNKHIFNWSKNDWKKADGQYLQHMDLWQEIYALLEEKSLSFKVHYQKNSPNPNNNLLVIHRSSEYVMKAKKSLMEVQMP
jgi:ribonuclease HI